MQEPISTYSCEFVMNTQLTPQPFIIYRMLYPGLYILAGAPKVGKSWLALDLCLSVASGEQFLKHDTSSGQVLYMSLEDTLLRLQNRLYELTDEPQENLSLAVDAKTIGGGLEEQIEQFKQNCPGLKLIVIDTLQKIREAHDISYATDYKELSSLKALADKLRIAIVLIHHTRKCFDSDPFNRISGSTGILGCVDGSMVLIESGRGSRRAKLYCTGRDIEPMELNLVFRGHRWSVEDDVPERKPDLFPFAIHDLIMTERTFRGTATELCELLYQRFAVQYFPNHVTRDLVQHTAELEKYGVQFRSGKSHGTRIIRLEYVPEGDGSGGSLLCSEVTVPTDPQDTENVYSALSTLGDGSFEGDSNSPNGGR